MPWQNHAEAVLLHLRGLLDLRRVPGRFLVLARPHLALNLGRTLALRPPDLVLAPVLSLDLALGPTLHRPLILEAQVLPAVARLAEALLKDLSEVVHQHHSRGRLLQLQGKLLQFQSHLCYTWSNLVGMSMKTI